MSTHADVVLIRIRKNLQNCGALLNNGNYTSAKAILGQCKSNLDRISSLISNTCFTVINNSITVLYNICNENTESAETESSHYSAERQIEATMQLLEYIANRSRKYTIPVERTIVYRGRGRPSVNISREQLQHFLSEGYTAKMIANHFKCSKTVIYKKMYNEGLKFRQKYMAIQDAHLLQIIANLHASFPNSGAEMMCGLLKARGVFVQRERVRRLLATVDPVGTATRWGSTINRRVYSVAAPNCLWHMDAHLKLVRWGFVTHGCIDGYSRLIIYARCATSITANTVIQIFVPGIVKYGIPSRIRSDHGYENYFVAVLMNIVRGVDRGSHITGKSVHNQRIERLWRDVFQQVINKFYVEFYCLESEGNLDPTNVLHLFVLQSVYLSEINNALEMFVKAWNRHKIRTENYRTPRQMWLDGLLHNINSRRTSILEVFGEHGDIFNRITEELTNLGINADAGVIETPDHSTLTAHFNLTEKQTIAFRNILQGDITPKEKYTEGVLLLS